MGDTGAAYTRVLQALQRQELIFTAQDTVESLRCWVEVYRATVSGHGRYRTEQRVRCPIHLLRASAQPDRPEDQPGLMARDDWGWGELTEAGVHLAWVPGTHITMMTAPQVRKLAGVIRQALLV